MSPSRKTEKLNKHQKIKKRKNYRKKKNMKLYENERIDDLQYKDLKLIQNKAGFCFGVDSVLLSDFAKGIKKNSIVVDIGTGSGIIGLLLCKKTELKKIYGVEIQKEVAEMEIGRAHV